MPRANPDYAGITKAAQAISRAEVQDLDADPKAADTLSGRTDIVRAPIQRNYHERLALKRRAIA